MAGFGAKVMALAADIANEKQPAGAFVTDADSRQDHTVPSANGVDVQSLSFTGGSTTNLVQEDV